MMLSLATRSYLAYRWEVDYKGLNGLNIYIEYCHIYSSYHNCESIIGPESRVHHCIYELSEPKRYAYTTNNTLT
jgi:hypothetical protein